MPPEDAVPESRGQRMPPPRLPPAGVGTDVPERPRRFPPRRSLWNRWRTWLLVAGLLTIAGAGGFSWVGATGAMRTLSVTALAIGIGMYGGVLWPQVLRPWLASRRRGRWNRHRAANGQRRNDLPNDR